MHPLDRAADLARREPVDPADWEQTAAGVMRRIRASIRPGRRLLVPLPDDRGSATFVNERVVVVLLRRALLTVDGSAPSRTSGSRWSTTAAPRWTSSWRRATAPTCRCWVPVPRGGRGDARRLLLGAADAVDVRVSVVDVTLDDPRL